MCCDGTRARIRDLPHSVGGNSDSRHSQDIAGDRSYRGMDVWDAHMCCGGIRARSTVSNIQNRL